MLCIANFKAKQNKYSTMEKEKLGKYDSSNQKEKWYNKNREFVHSTIISLFIKFIIYYL